MEAGKRHDNLNVSLTLDNSWDKLDKSCGGSLSRKEQRQGNKLLILWLIPVICYCCKTHITVNQYRHFEHVYHLYTQFDFSLHFGITERVTTAPSAHRRAFRRSTSINVEKRSFVWNKGYLCQCSVTDFLCCICRSFWVLSISQTFSKL